jgi:hypothetical protein
MSPRSITYSVYQLRRSRLKSASPLAAAENVQRLSAAPLTQHHCITIRIEGPSLRAGAATDALAPTAPSRAPKRAPTPTAQNSQ